MRSLTGASALALALAAALLPQLSHAKTVVVATSADPEHFNPGITTGSHTHTVADSLYNGLTARDRDGRPVPDLAQRWEVSDDGLVYTFHLAPARWHDGKPVTSEDVRFTFESILLPHHARTGASLRGRLAAIEAPDPQTVVLRLNAPYAPLLQQLDVTEAPILPAHVYAGGDPVTSPANLSPVGSGPFRFVSHVRDEAIVLERNPDYFKPGAPRIERLAFRIVPDNRSALLGYAAGEIDVLRSVGGVDAPGLQARNDTVLEAVTSGPGGGNCVMTVVYNLDRPALQDLRVRQALAQAIDRQRIVDDVLFGYGRVSQSPVSSGIGWAAVPGMLDHLPYSPEAARALLAEAGATALNLDIVHFPQFSGYADAMRQDLAAVGVSLASRPLDRAATVDAIYMKRDFDLGLISYCHGADPEIGFRRTLASDAIGPVPFSNGAGYSHAEVDALFANAVALTDLDARGEVYRRIQEQAVRDLPYWWLVETESLSAWRQELDGFAMWSGQFAETAGPN